MRKTALCCLLLMAFLLRAIIHATEPKLDDKTTQAKELYSAGYLLTQLGHFHEAIQLYEKSLELMPTAEAYTFLGWTYGIMGDYGRAIEQAKKAIDVDPEFGNPYNDIGAYLIEQEKDDEAIAYLEKAKRAKRYCCYQFPYFNLGRIFFKRKMYEKAREEFKKALEIDPHYIPAAEALELLKLLGIKET